MTQEFLEGRRISCLFQELFAGQIIKDNLVGPLVCQFSVIRDCFFVAAGECQ